MKILKNTTSSDIDLSYIGIYIPQNDERTIVTTDYDLLASEDSITEITPYINSGDIVINNGTIDLAAAEALIFITHTEDASGTLFDNTGNDFESNNTQDAIEEARDSSKGHNFSHHKIVEDETITIPENQQMTVFTELEIEGELVIDGELVITE